MNESRCIQDRKVHLPKRLCYQITCKTSAMTCCYFFLVVVIAVFSIWEHSKGSIMKD